MRSIITSVCLLLFFSGLARAVPVLTDVTGTLTDGSAVTVTGSGFGAQGPSINLYDNFEAGGAPGNEIDAAATVGSWWGNATKPRFDNIGYSGGQSMRIHDDTTAGQRGERIMKASFAPTTEFYLSYWLQIPTGFTFPGTDVPGKIPTRAIHASPVALSTWKLVWVFDGDNGTDNNDIALPTHVGGELLLLGNNTREIGSRIRLTNPAVSNVSQSDSIFRFGEWIRITFWLKAGSPDPLGPGQSRYTLEIPTSNIREIRTSIDPVFSTDVGVAPTDRPPYQWTHMNFTGFLGNGVDPSPDCSGPIVGWCKTRPLFDDVYLATGPGAQARIEICESPVYNNCKKFGYITVASAGDWNDTTINGVIRRGALTNAEVQRAFAYVYDKDGSVNATGFPLCPKCPLPPTSLMAE